MVSVSQNDNLNQCADAEEQAVVKAEGAASGPMIRAINAIGRALAAEFPHVLLHTLAYDYTEQPPKVTKPLPSVVVQVASSGIGDPRIQAWGRVCRQIFVWDYWVNFKHFVQPYPNYYHLGPNIQWYHSNGVSGMYEEGDGWGTGGELDALKAYLIEEMLWDPTQVPELLIAEFLSAYYGESAVFVEQYMERMHEALLDAAPYKLTNADEPTAPFLSPDALLTSVALLKKGAAVVTTDIRRVRMETMQLAVYYPILLRWTEMRAFAANRSMHMVWPLEPTAAAALVTFTRYSTQINLTNLMEPDSNYSPPRHDLSWFAKQVHCNCSWDLPCCQKQACCGGPPPPAPSPPLPPPPGPASSVTITAMSAPTLIYGEVHKLAATGMAKFVSSQAMLVVDGSVLTDCLWLCNVAGTDPVQVPGWPTLRKLSNHV